MQQFAQIGPMATGVEAELALLPHLLTDLRQVTRHVAATYKECLAAQSVADLLTAIPKPRESVHLVISGRFALADFVPAVLLLAMPAKIQALHIATLGFSKRNINALCRLVDAGQIGTLRLLASHYFKHTSTPIYEYAVTELERRRPQMSFFSLRTHAKILAMELTDRRTVVIASSANLRSNKNIEQMTVFGDPALYRFHRAWIDELYSRAPHRKETHAKAKIKR